MISLVDRDFADCLALAGLDPDIGQALLSSWRAANGGLSDEFRLSWRCPIPPKGHLTNQLAQKQNGI
jgi:hypothetical protein